MGEMEAAAEVDTGPPRPHVAEAPPTFDRFFAEQHVRLLRASFVLTGNRQEAEELTQEAFLSVWERWDRVAVMADPVGYLYRTAMNRHRSKRRALERAAKRLVGIERSEDGFVAADERDAVARALTGLTPRQRAAIVLTAMLGFGTAEAARILGVRPATVRSLTSQGRAALREVLDR
jgi:RNA polymerase sigma-70 factor (ECF subfamily)